MSGLRKLKHEKAIKDLVDSTKSVSLTRNKKPKIDYLDETYLSQITDDEGETYDFEDDNDKEIDFDQNDEMNDNIDYIDEDVLGEEKAEKNYMIDNNIAMENGIILTSFFLKICDIFSIPEQDNMFNIQRSINSYLVKTRNKSINDEAVITALELFYKYTQYIRITNFDSYIRKLVERNYLKFPTISSSSFIDVSIIRDENQIIELYNIIFTNANNFIERLTGKRSINSTSNYDIRKYESSLSINPPMNPDLIRLKEFELVLFKELTADFTRVNEYRYAPLLNNFTEIINLSSRSLEINWGQKFTHIDTKILNIPITIRNLISFQKSKFSKFTKSDLIDNLEQDLSLIFTIGKFYFILKSYKDNIDIEQRKKRQLEKDTEMDIDVAEKPFSNLFMKKKSRS